MDVIVDHILSQMRAGVIFSGRKPDGGVIRVRVSGEACWPVAGEIYSVEGTAITYKDDWGNEWDQIETNKIDRIQTSGALVGAWLEQLRNVGPDRCNRLLQAFGDQLIDKLMDPDAVGEIAEVIDPAHPHLAHRLALSLVAMMTSRAAEEVALVPEVRFLQRLEEYGIKNRRAARRLWRLIGSPDAENILPKKPYLPAIVMRWPDADSIGQRLLITVGVADWETHPDRLVGAMVSVWQDILSNGDTAATRETLIHKLRGKGVDAELALDVAEQKLAVRKVGDLYRAPGAAFIEDRLANKLLRMAEHPPSNHLPGDLETAVRDAEARTGLSLSEEQRKAVIALLRAPLGVLQGGAGVGKTVITKILATVWETHGGNVHLSCVAGKAALQLSHGASAPGNPRLAFTLTRFTDMLRKGIRQAEELLAMDPLGRRPWLQASAPQWPRLNKRSLVILDEASMIDTPALDDIVQLMPLGAHLLLVGDHGQLFPVGYGRVFHDLVEDGRHVQTLSQVRRQQADNPILEAALKIRQGIVPDVPQYTSPDPDSNSGPPPGIFIAECECDTFDWLDTAKRVHQELWAAAKREAAAKRIPLKIDDIMTCAAKKDTVSWFNLQMVELRRKARPDRPEISLGFDLAIAVGDPVICTRNHYAEGLVNGLLGVVREVGPDCKVSIQWDGEDEPRPLDRGLLADIDLAYATTGHKMQGSAAQWVVVLLEDSKKLLTREWLYTAVTRSRITVVLVGPKSVLAKAVARRTERTTGFSLVPRKLL